MTRPGPPPKPTELKILGGNPGKRRVNRAEPVFPPAKMRMPRNQMSQEARRAWHELAPILAGAGLLTAGDVYALLAACVHWSIMMAAAAEIERDGATITTTMGEKRKNPAASVLEANSRLFRGYAAEFGLSPSSRVRLEGAGDPQEPTLAEMLFQDFGQDADADEDPGEE